MNTASISIRPAGCDDYVALWSIAALDSSTLPAEPLLVADEGGTIVAAISLATGEVVADPFRRTAGAVALLPLRASPPPAAAPRPRGLLDRLRGRPAATAPAA